MKKITEMEKLILEEIYYDISHPAGYSSVNRLYNAAKKKLKTISRAKTLEYLQSQPTYTLHKPLIKRFNRRKIIAPHLDAIWEADLVSLIPIKKENSNYCYILTCIDIVSRYAFAVPLYKKTGDEVIRGFKTIFKKRRSNHKQEVR